MFRFDDSRAILQATPRTLRAMLEGLPERLTLASEGAGTWNISQVLCHLAHNEADDWVPRIKLVLAKGTSEPFRPFDREAGFAHYAGWSVARLLDEFGALREESLRTLDGLRLTPDDMRLEGLHPVFGPVTIEQLLASWICHDLTHIHQISRILARYHAAYVGPFAKFMGVLAGRGSTTSSPPPPHAAKLDG